MKDRHFRADDESWNRALARAKRDGVTLSKVLREFIVSYGNDEGLDTELARAAAILERARKRL